MGIGPRFGCDQGYWDGRPGMSRGSSTEDLNTHIVPTKKNKAPGNPDPFKFDIVRVVVRGKYLLAEVKYPDCTNFHGSKIMLVKANLSAFSAKKSLDPHFLEEDGNTEIFARFRPTEDGWSMGIAVLNALKD